LGDDQMKTMRFYDALQTQFQPEDLYQRAVVCRNRLLDSRCAALKAKYAPNGNCRLKLQRDCCATCKEKDVLGDDQMKTMRFYDALQTQSEPEDLTSVQKSVAEMDVTAAQ